VVRTGFDDFLARFLQGIAHPAGFPQQYGKQDHGQPQVHRVFQLEQQDLDDFQQVRRRYKFIDLCRKAGQQGETGGRCAAHPEQAFGEKVIISLDCVHQPALCIIKLTQGSQVGITQCYCFVEQFPTFYRQLREICADRVGFCWRETVDKIVYISVDIAHAFTFFIELDLE
jgi:hypothetical protein